MLMARSRMNEASPVVTGRADDESAAVVFANWRTDPKLQERFNPFLELEEAARLRDEILHRFVLKPGHLVGHQSDERRVDAQIALIRALVQQRRWGRKSIDAYFGFTMPDGIWAKLLAEAIS
jgi:hypothetical protein